MGETPSSFRAASDSSHSELWSEVLWLSIVPARLPSFFVVLLSVVGVDENLLDLWFLGVDEVIWCLNEMVGG